MPGWNFAATGSYARSNNPITSYPFTIFIQAQNNDLDASQDTLFLMGQSDSNGNYWGIRRPGSVSTLEITASVGGTANPAATTTTITQGVPFTVVGIFTNATSRRLIINGDWAGSALGTVSATPPNIDRMSFGRKDDTTAGQPWEGDIFRAALWNAAITEAETLALANMQWPARIRPNALRSFWPNWDSQDGGLTIRDWRGQAHLTLAAGTRASNGMRMAAVPRWAGQPSGRRSRVTMSGAF